MPRIPLIEDLIAGPIPSGSNILVEFDPGSQWYNASLTIGAGWLKTDGFLDYNATAQPPANVRSKLKRLGLDVDSLEKEGKIELTDWYTATLGKKSSEDSAFNSLKVADLSINISKFGETNESSRLAWLGIRDNSSTLARFNDEKAWVEFEVTRAIPVAASHRAVMFRGIVNGVHSEWVYRRLEDAYDGIIDFKLDETGEETQDLIRIRSMRDLRHDRKWHHLRISDNFEVAIEK